MERIEQKLMVLQQALSRLQESIEFFQETRATDNNSFNKKVFLIAQDSVIQRFEFSFELTWKFFKIYLESRQGIVALSPKKVFLECRTLGVITEQEESVFLEVVDSRNSTTHEYSEIIAKGVCNAICSSYYPTIKAVVNRIAV